MPLGRGLVVDPPLREREAVLGLRIELDAATHPGLLHQRANFAGERAGKLKVIKVDVDEFSVIAGEVGIRSVPTLMVVKDGQVVAARAGSLPRQALAAFVDEALAR